MQRLYASTEKIRHVLYHTLHVVSHVLVWHAVQAVPSLWIFLPLPISAKPLVGSMKRTRAIAAVTATSCTCEKLTGEDPPRLFSPPLSSPLPSPPLNSRHLPSPRVTSPDFFPPRGEGSTSLRYSLPTCLPFAEWTVFPSLNVLYPSFRTSSHLIFPLFPHLPLRYSLPSFLIPLPPFNVPPLFFPPSLMPFSSPILYLSFPFLTSAHLLPNPSPTAMPGS